MNYCTIVSTLIDLSTLMNKLISEVKGFYK